MASVNLDKQLMITVNNKVGTMAEVAHIISSSGINMIATCAYAVENKGLIMFVCEDHQTAKKLLKAKKYDVREEEVILLSIDNKPGELQAYTQKIADAGIDITLLYGSVSKSGKESRIVIVSEDNQTVLTVLKLR